MSLPINHGRYLAWQLKKRKNEKQINRIKIREKSIDDPKVIIQKIIKYYEDLYKKDVDIEEVEDYLSQQKIPEIKEEKVQMLDAPISAVEIRNAIKKAKIGKTPDPDGLPAEFYIKKWKKY